MAAQPEKRAFNELLECPITGERFVDPVIADDGHTYERSAIVQWLQNNSTSPMTREPISRNSLRPNYFAKQMLELDQRSAKQNYRFKLNVDVKKKGNRALFQNGGKFLYEAEWLNNLQGPEIVLLQIRGARALKEASFYVKLSQHRNIVRTFGLVETGDEQNTGMTLLQEYAPLGDLAELLLNASILPQNTGIFYEIFLQIIDALVYLTEKCIVHGDLACRNILVFKFNPTDLNQNLVKLTDFGLARGSSLYQTTTYTTSTIAIFPLRWSAPEIIQAATDRQCYTEKSDMFSMGVLMWEALSKGAFPWQELTDDQVKKKVLGGERLKRPATNMCTDHLWPIILRCMNHEPQYRPTFKELHRLVSNLYPNRVPLRSSIPSLDLQPSQAASTNIYSQPSRSATMNRNLDSILSILSGAVASAQVIGKITC
ncbi:unnamed protein product [Adineta steineri]|uniref:Uncharacterized protein n=1 Tax=Adineta steineri TaxID=433720 RepID=A0A815J1B0_9BILA|nr:unnamed protein product [Adineta steineri]CAF4145027.1 unnamed protein product [Adineta steineri]